MSTGITLLLVFGCLGVIAGFKGRDLYQELRLYRTWRTRYYAGQIEDSAASPQAASVDPPAMFDLAAPTTGTVLEGAGRAAQQPPADLRVSMAEHDRLDPVAKYPVPLGWWMGATKPVLATARLVDDVNMTLVTGFTDSGKDNLVLTWLYSLAYRYAPQQLQFALICGKGGLSLNGWHTKAHTWRFARGKHDIQPTMDALVKERERRTKILWDAQCEKWEEYTGTNLPLLIVYVSELMLLQSIVGKTELADWLNEELTSCRAMGIRYIIGTQNATKLDTRWRSQVSLHVAGYQQSQDGDEPNTGISTKALRALGTRADGVVVGVPPSELPIPPAGAGVFTLVQGRTVLTVRAPFLDKAQRQWWLSQLPDDPKKIAELQAAELAANPLLAALVKGEALPFETPMATPSVVPVAPRPLSLAEVIKSKTLGELEKDNTFVSSVRDAYSRLGTVRQVVIEVFGSYTGSRDQLVSRVLRVSGDLPERASTPAVSAA